MVSRGSGTEGASNFCRLLAGAAGIAKVAASRLEEEEEPGREVPTDLVSCLKRERELGCEEEKEKEKNGREDALMNSLKSIEKEGTRKEENKKEKEKEKERKRKQTVLRCTVRSNLQNVGWPLCSSGLWRLDLGGMNREEKLLRWLGGSDLLREQ